MSKQRLHNRPRNPLYNYTLIHKGGVHRKTNKAMRKQAKQQLQRNKWDELMVFIASFMSSSYLVVVLCKSVHS